MKSKALLWMVSAVAAVVLALGMGGLAQDRTPMHFRGLINDYTPETIGGNPVGPWEMHGTWSLDLKGRSGLADFSAAMTMDTRITRLSTALTRLMILVIPMHAQLILTTSP